MLVLGFSSMGGMNEAYFEGRAAVAVADYVVVLGHLLLGGDDLLAAFLDGGFKG